MKRIPDAVVAEIKQANDIVAVVEQYLPLQKKSSSNFFGLCPFHNEDTPSFSVNPRDQFYYCFGCHKGGDVVNFVKEMEHLDYPQALRFLAERANIDVPQVDDEAYQENKQRREALQKIMLEAARYYYKNIQSPNARHVLDYLKMRKIPATNLKRFGLGFSLDAWDGLYRNLRALGYDDELLLASGLIKRSERGSLYDLFRNRLMFPIISAFGKGRVVGFGGRVMDDSKPKYINSPETEFFTKGNHLYAMNLAKQSSYDFFLLVEGYLDVMAAFEAGVDSAVAPLGTALTAAQAKLMKQFKSKVIVCFDADRAGKAATLRSFAILEDAGLEVNVLVIPDGKDPDDYVHAHGGAAFKALLSETLPVFDYRLLLAKASGSPQGALNPQLYLNALLDFLPDIKSESLREVYLGKAAKEMGVSLASLRSDVAKESLKRKQSAGSKPSTLPASTDAYRSIPTPVQREQLAPERQSYSTERSPHYKAALTMLLILSKYPELIKVLPRTVEVPLIAVLGPEEFCQELISLLNAEELRFDALYHFIGEKHPEPDRLLSELTALRVKIDELSSLRPVDSSGRNHMQEDLLLNYKRCRSYALKKQANQTYKAMQDPNLDAQEKAKIKMLYDILLKEINQINDVN